MKTSPPGPTLLSTRLMPLLLTVMLLAPLATAQIDAQAATLLEGIAASYVLPTTSLDHLMVVTIYLNDQEYSSSTRTIIDYEGRRAAIIAESFGTTINSVFQDEQVSVVVNGAASEPQTGVRESLEALLQPLSWVGPREGDTATFDGHWSYADAISGENILAGDRVSITSTVVIAGEERITINRYVFGPAGEVLGYVIEAPATEPVLFVYDEPHTGGYLPATSGRSFVPQGEDWRLFTHIEFHDVRIDEPVDEAVFD